jgi:hypothetical protein
MEEYGDDFGEFWRVLNKFSNPSHLFTILSNQIKYQS